MICYRDMTFCVSPKCKNKCGRKLTKKIRKEADKWFRSWNTNQEREAPIAVSCFCGGDLREVLGMGNPDKEDKNKLDV